MKLSRPTDFDILEALSDGKRNTAANLAHEIDKNRSYINTRLPVLDDYGLITRVGPAPNSGLYEIAERGLAALEHRDAYGDEAFEELIEGAVSE
ncbi:MAG: winged helix-turn-helix transcriptional regulator [Haloferacaceae archaeon]